MESKFRRFFFLNQNTLLPAVAEFIQLRYVYIRSNKIYLEKYHYLIKSDFQTKSGVCLRPMQKNWQNLFKFSASVSFQNMSVAHMKHMKKFTHPLWNRDSPSYTVFSPLRQASAEKRLKQHPYCQRQSLQSKKKKK